MTREQAIGVLGRAATILGNMTAENFTFEHGRWIGPRPGLRPWWNFWTSRWAVSDEPLRADAKSVLPMIRQLKWELEAQTILELNVSGKTGGAPIALPAPERE